MCCAAPMWCSCVLSRKGAAVRIERAACRWTDVAWKHAHVMLGMECVCTQLCTIHGADRFLLSGSCGGCSLALLSAITNDRQSQPYQVMVVFCLRGDGWPGMGSIDSTHGLVLVDMVACRTGTCLPREYMPVCLAAGLPVWLAGWVSGCLAIWISGRAVCLVCMCVWSALSASCSVGSWGWLLL
jgi:hypothetical protein